MNERVTCGQGEDAEEQSSDLENTCFYTNTAPQMLTHSNKEWGMDFLAQDSVSAKDPLSINFQERKR